MIIRKLALIFTLVFSVNVFADEVSDAISEGLNHYKKGDLTNAAAQLDYAATLIRQQKAGKITAVFPDPMAGWTAEEAESNSAGGMMLGGGITANRSYYKGDNSVEIELVMDSPMLQSVLMMFNNPSMIAMSGAKLIKVQGNKGMLRDEDSSVEIQLVINNNALFTIRGYGVSVSEVKAYAEALRLDKL